MTTANTTEPRRDSDTVNNSLTVAPDAQREAHTSGGTGSP